MASSSQTHGKPAGVEGSPLMPIRLLLEHDHAFTPEDVKILIEAFEGALNALKLVDRDDQLSIMVAKLIIEFAKEGERDPARLRDLVLKTLRPE
jgi:hypothetical protein